MATQTPTSDIGEAAVSAVLRHGAAAVLWIAWFVARSPLEGSPSLISIVIVAGLVSLYLGWVNKPIETALGPSYARRPHWSALFVVPTVFAIVMLVRDLVLTGRAVFNA